jgi:hypothetical protein
MRVCNGIESMRRLGVQKFTPETTLLLLLIDSFSGLGFTHRQDKI